MTATEPATIGTTLLELARAGRFAEIRDMFAPTLRSLITPESLRATWEAEVGKHGPVSTVGTAVTDPPGPGGTVVRVPVAFAHGQVTVLATVHESGWVIGIQFAPADAAAPAEPWQTPDYADPESFHEHEVTVGSDPLAVSGTLALPHGAGPHPAVLLLPGSGPMDRDETVGRNKPFKDLAWGLATRGIAVLRFDKVTLVHNGLPAEFTADDEYVRPATAALDLLRRHPAVDRARIFVLGHSMGGSMVPRVAAADPGIAGSVVLAGGAEPLQWTAVRQLRYLSSLDADAARSLQPAVDALTAQARAVDSPDLSPATPAAELPFGAPAAYWLDLRGYDPAAAAAAVRQPMLILQGGRDYQVTVADDLSRWRAALADRPDVTIRVYEADNHLFFPGRGPSSPAEYEHAQHMDPAVITDIANWLTRP